MDRHLLYERCVQAPETTIPVLRAIHGGAARRFGEDFCGTGAMSRAWIAAVPGGSAVAVDHDPEPLAALANVPGVETLEGDVRTATASADIIYCGNFSIGHWHERSALLDYLRHVRARLRPGGIFVCDLYGGATAYATGDIERSVPLDDDRLVVYTWEQQCADPRTARVRNACHFRVEDGQGRPLEEHRNAFVYDWRLWGLAELREAFVEAGFPPPDVYPRQPDAMDGDGCVFIAPIGDPLELDEDYDVLVVGRVFEETTAIDRPPSG